MGREMSDFIAANIQRAIDRHDIRVFFQPVIRTVSCRLCSFEALARWTDPDHGMIYPDEFIPVLEWNRNIYLLDLYVIRQVCGRIRWAMDSGEIPVPVSVNLSRLDFELCDIFSMADGIVSEFQIPHEYIYFEITESVMAEEKDLMIEVVEKFRSAGYQIWMDDFGSAYSSLNVLKEISFNELKLDMCFLRPFNQRSQFIASSIIEMAKKIDIHTLAEGVETEEQFRFLRNIGCEKVQGYYFGKPMYYEEAINHLKMKGIFIELPQDRTYYDDIGQVNILSAVPFMTKDERDNITTARELNSIPLALVEASKESFSILFYNTAFEITAEGTGIFTNAFRQEILRQPQPYHCISEKVLNLMDSTRSGEEGRMNFTFHEDFYEIRAKCVAQTKERYCVLLRMMNLSKVSQSANTRHLDDLLRRIYALYERITLIDLKEDAVTPLYIATRENLVSGRSGLKKMAREYADQYIFPADKKEYLDLLDPDRIRAYFSVGGRSFTRKLLRTSIRHGRYAWKSYTLLLVEEDVYLIMISNVDQTVSTIRKGRHSGNGSGTFSDALLWQNLLHSDLIPVFWKDADRRFLGAAKAFLDYYGFDSVDEILGKNDEELGWHIHADAFRNDELRVIHEGVTTHNIPGHCINEGENKEILASKAPLYDENGKISGLMGFFIDKELLTENDRRGKETRRRDLLTGLLNSRGISEEAIAFRDEYYLRGVDFVRIHVAINDLHSLNAQYGFDFGDKAIAALGYELKKTFGRTCAVGRFSGYKYILLKQVESKEETADLKRRIKEIANSVQEIDGIPITLYLSVGYVLFSEFQDLEEQNRKAEIRLLADHDNSVPAESLMANSAEIFHLFDRLPVMYGVYHVTVGENNGPADAVLFYMNQKLEERIGKKASEVLGRSIREMFPHFREEWFENLKQAAWSARTVTGTAALAPGGREYHYSADQIIYPGYCAVTYLEEAE